MTVFSRDWSQERLDYRLLQFGPMSLYYDRQKLSDDIAELETLGYRLRQLDVGRLADPGAFQGAIAALLEFPDFYGRNLDAFNDCISQIPYDWDHDLLLVLGSFDRFYARHRDFAQGVLDIMWSNAFQGQLVGFTMLTLIQSDDPRLHLSNVAPRTIYWNPREFLDSSRGLK